MRAKVIIENRETTIVLTPENDFEVDLIDKVRLKKEKHNINTRFDAEYIFGSYAKQKIEILIKECTN